MTTSIKANINKKILYKQTLKDNREASLLELRRKKGNYHKNPNKIILETDLFYHITNFFFRIFIRVLMFILGKVRFSK